MEFLGSKLTNRILASAAPTLLIVLAVPYTLLPFFADHTHYQVMGSMILQGSVPYRDFWDPNAIMIYYLNALSIKFFGNTMFGFRVFDLLYLTAVLSALFLFVRLIYGQTTGILSCLLYGTMYFSMGYSSTGLKDGNSLLFLLVGSIMYRVARTRHRQVWYFGAGFSLALAFWMKYPTFIFFPLFLFHLVVSRMPRQGVRETLGAAILFCLGFSVPCIVVLAYLGGQGALTDMYEQTIIYILRVHSSMLGKSSYPALTWGMVRAVTKGHLPETGLVLAALFFLILVRGLRCASRNDHSEGIILAIGVIIQTVIQKIFWPYRMLPLLAILSIYLSLILANLLDLANRSDASPGKYTLANAGSKGFLIAFLVTFVFHSSQLIYDSYSQLNLYSKDKVRYYGGFRSNHGSGSVLTEMYIADYLREHTTREDRVLMWDSGLLAAYLADRATTNFPFVLPLVINPYQQEPSIRMLLFKWRKRFIEDFDRDPPKYVIISMDCQMFHHRFSRSIMGFPEFDLRLKKRYRLENKIGASLLFGLRE